MASGNRASMREGPLAQLFRKTEEDEPQRKERKEEPRGEPRQEKRQQKRQEPRGGRPLPEGGPSPQITRPRPESGRGMELTEAAKRAQQRAEERAARREREAEHEPYSRYDGVPTPEERLRSVFSADIPENIMEREPEPIRAPEPQPAPYAMPSAGHVTEPVLRVVGVGGAGVNAVNRMIEAEVEGVEFIAVNTDTQSLEQSAAHNRLHIGGEITRGLGSGSNPELGRLALLGIGMGTGEHRAMDAVAHAIESPLLETSLEGARSILLSVTGGRDLSLWEVNEAAKAVTEAAHPEANIIFGAMVDDKVEDQVWVTVVATGYGDRPQYRATPRGDAREPRIPADHEPRVRRGRERGSSLSDIDVPEFIPR